MHTLLLTVHYFLCIFLIIVILLQAGKGAEMGAAFTGSSQTLFGSRGPATFFQKMTAVIALLFLVTCITLAKVAKETKATSVVDQVPAATAPTQPSAEPAATPAAGDAASPAAATPPTETGTEKK